MWLDHNPLTSHLSLPTFQELEDILRASEDSQQVVSSNKKESNRKNEFCFIAKPWYTPKEPSKILLGAYLIGSEFHCITFQVTLTINNTEK